MTIRLIPERCIACGLCQTYSDTFDYDDEGIVRFTDTEELLSHQPVTPAILTASKSCPTKAILTD